ncbi:MAG: extracellular solute-binding protein [Anaerolineae bacterium]|nr:extracellular solute-binding protein [Anaerolineae bacterium]
MRSRSLFVILLLGLAACAGATPTAQAPAPATLTPPPAAPTTAPTATSTPSMTAVVTAAAKTTQPTATAVPTQESPPGQKIGKGVADVAAVDAIDISGKPVEVIFWHIFTANQEQGLKDIIAAFEVQYPNIKVRPVYKGMYDVTRKATLTGIAADLVPDMVWSFPYTVSEYAREDVVQPLDPFMQSGKYGLGTPSAGATAPLRANIDAALLDAYKYQDFQGQTLSLPPGVSADVMYYNADWLKQLGYARPPETYDQFMEVCARVKATTPDKWCTGLLPDASRFVAFVFSRGGDILTADNQPAFREKGLDVLRWYRELFDQGYAYQPGQQFGDQADFGLGKTLFAFGTSTGAPFYRRVVTDPATNKERFAWSFAPYPRTTAQPVVNVFGPSAAILKTTPERSLAAWQFLKFWLSPESSATWGIQSNYYPVNRASRDTPAMQAYLKDNPVYAQGLDLFQYARSEPTVPGWQAARGGIANGLVAVMTNKATPQEAIDMMVKATTEALK